MANPTVVVFSPTGGALAFYERGFYEVSFNLPQARFGGVVCACGSIFPNC